MNKIYFNGKFVDEPEAVVPVTTHALHYGTGNYEGIRAYYDEGQKALDRKKFLIMAIAIKEIESAAPDVAADSTRIKKPWFSRGGFLIGKLISERRGANRAYEIAGIARKLSLYEGILPDPFKTSARLRVTRLIARIDQRIQR